MAALTLQIEGALGTISVSAFTDAVRKLLGNASRYRRGRLPVCRRGALTGQ